MTFQLTKFRVAGTHRWTTSCDSRIVDEVVLLNNAGEIPVEIGYKNLNGQLVLVDAEALPEIARRLARSKGRSA